MSGGRPWYRRYPSDFIHGTMELSVSEKGAYSVCLDLMYDRGGPIPDDPRWLARMCGCSMQLWKKIRAKLVEIGKLNLTDDGRLANGRATYEMQRDHAYADEQREHGKRGGRGKVAEKSQESRKKVESKLDLFEETANENNDVEKPSQYSESREESNDSSQRRVAAPLPRKSASQRPPDKPSRRRSPDPWKEKCVQRIAGNSRLTTGNCYAVVAEMLQRADQDRTVVEYAVDRLEAVRPPADRAWGFLVKAAATRREKLDAAVSSSWAAVDNGWR